MRLSEKLRQLGNGGNRQDRETGLPVGSIRGAALSYTQQITALFEGQTISLLGSADIVGMSQCEKFIPLGSATNTPDWAPSEEVEVIAINGVPVGKQGQTEPTRYAPTR